MKETLHIIARNLSREELLAIGSSAGPVFWHFNIKQLNLPNKVYTPITGPEDKKGINYRIMDQILRFSNEKAAGSTVSDFLEYQKMNFWFYQRLSVYMAARNLEYLIEEIKLASKKYSIILYTYIPEIVLSHHLPDNIEYRHRDEKQAGRISNTISIGFNMLFALVRVCFRSAGKIKDRHIILDNAKPVRIYQGEGKKYYKGNFVFHNLFKILDNRFCLITEAGIPGKRTANISDYKKSIQYRVLKLRSISSDQILAKAILGSAERKEIRKIRKDLSYKLNSLVHQFRDTEYSIFTYLLSGQKPSFRIYIMRYIGFREICKKYKPLSVTASDENSPYNKSLLDAAKYLAIKTIGIQHGAIHELHPAYRFTPEEAKKDITPRLTLTWGEYWKDLLINKGNYSKQGLMVTGQIRTDMIEELKKARYDNNAGKKVILFASQPQRDPSLRRLAASDLFGAAAKSDGILIQLKPHPLEKDYFEYYSSIADENNLTNIEFMPEHDLYELIHKSDAVYTCFSTVGTEAVYFSKPLIIHDPLEQDIQGYIAAGVGHKVKNTENCYNALEKLVSGSLVQEKESVSEFINKYAYLIDGEVSERVLSAITDGS